MKRFILSISAPLALLILFSGCANSNRKAKDNTVVELPDEQVIVEIPNENFKAYLLENFDTNKDGLFSLSEAKAIKEIDCSGREISSLAGIEKFENLEFLDCSDNLINELELRYNKKLERLICTNNNNPLAIYIGMSSPMRNPAIQGAVEKGVFISPVDESKFTYDRGVGKTVQIHLEYDY